MQPPSLPPPLPSTPLLLGSMHVAVRIYYTPHTIHHTLYTTHYTPHTTHHTLHTTHYTPHTTHHTLYTTHCTPHTHKTNTTLNNSQHSCKMRDKLAGYSPVKTTKKRPQTMALIGIQLCKYLVNTSKRGESERGSGKWVAGTKWCAYVHTSG